MRIIHLLFVVISLAVFAPAAEARKSPLVDPDPVAIPAGLDSGQVAKDIKRALAGRGWAVTDEQPGRIDSTLHLRDHVARIRITYDDTHVRFAYIDSINLDHKIKKGVTYIHSNYLSWIGFLVSDLSTNMQLSIEG
ncbi:hypothetical protein [Marilutibacter alkalisoli]|uniref:Lipoprotein n=1 Tax=Marilutibacter alkalisoli TaxID=2591633 RepID=A0A514BVQ0_9GAMM|nr:hypothetical protein [Lysobacter alkalisoli]QDH71385.1 hypothetical protein FKV23_15770 [Lysobacter alkalisoli]